MPQFLRMPCCLEAEYNDLCHVRNGLPVHSIINLGSVFNSTHHLVCMLAKALITGCHDGLCAGTVEGAQGGCAYLPAAS